jgi:hypothetical protein
MNSLALLILGDGSIGKEKCVSCCVRQSTTNRHSVLTTTTITSVNTTTRPFVWLVLFPRPVRYHSLFPVSIWVYYPNIPPFFSFLSLSSLSFVINSSSSLFRFLGMSTLMVTKWSPRTLALPNLGAPLPLSRMT